MRLLDMTRSPYVALYFAFESAGESDRALWAVDGIWCSAESARTINDNEGIGLDRAFARVGGAIAELIYGLVYDQPFPSTMFSTFKPFTGVFALEPWKPDPRQAAQQALFLCAANIELGFMDNMAAHSITDYPVLYKFELPTDLRVEAIEQLAMMNVTAATLFPDLGGLARSLRTLTVRRIRNAEAPPPWETNR
jgi:hypothetical protein